MESVTGRVLGLPWEAKAFRRGRWLSPAALPWRCAYPRGTYGRNAEHPPCFIHAFCLPPWPVRGVNPHPPLQRAFIRDQRRVAVVTRGNLPKPSLPGLAQEGATPSAAGGCARHQAAAGCASSPALPRARHGGSAGASGESGGQPAGKEVRHHGMRKEQPL